MPKCLSACNNCNNLSAYAYIYSIYKCHAHIWFGCAKLLWRQPLASQQLLCQKIGFGPSKSEVFLCLSTLQISAAPWKRIVKKLPPEKINQVTRPKQSGRFSQNLFDHSFSIYDEYIMPWNSPTNCLHWVFFFAEKKTSWFHRAMGVTRK